MDKLFTNFSQQFGVKPPKLIHPSAVLVLVHGADGSIASFFELAKKLNIYVVALSYVPSLASDCKTIEQFAAVYLEQVQQYYTATSYILAGHSFGSLVAYEMAKQAYLLSNEPVPVILLDPNLPLAMRHYQVERGLELRLLASTIFSEQMIRQHNIYQCDEALLLALLSRCFNRERLETILSARKHCISTLNKYSYCEHEGVISTVVHASEKLDYDFVDQDTKYITNGTFVGGNHFTMLHSEHVEDIANIINARLSTLLF